jgi:hypothetical protein
MFQLVDKAADPAVHRIASAIANRCVWAIQAVLRGDDRRLAASEFYHICREEIGKPPGNAIDKQQPEMDERDT